MEKVQLTEKTARVLEILKDNGDVMFAADIADIDPALFDKGSRSVSPILVNLARKGWAEKAGEGQREVKDKDGNAVTRTYVQYKVTADGMELDYDLKA